MYTHNIALVGVVGAFVAVLLFSLFTRNLKKFKKFLICGVICALAYIPWLTMLFKQISNVQEHYWVSQFDTRDALDWTFKQMLINGGITVTFKLIFSLLLFSVLLRHIKLKSIKKAKTFKEIFALADNRFWF